MLNPDPDKFYTLPDAFDVLGREHYHDTWTGDEIAARNLPQPEPTSQILERAGRGSDRESRESRERADKVKRAKKAAMGVDIPTLRRSQRHPAPLDPQQIQENEREHSARIRRGMAEAKLRRLLYGNDILTVLLNSQDGRLVDISPALWLADKFTVDFASGQASWADLEEGRQIAYHGLVLVDRQRFDQDVRKSKQSSGRAVTLCKRWARNLPPEPVWRKKDFTTKALKEFQGLSQKQAWKVWDEEVPDKWKKRGRKSRAS